MTENTKKGGSCNMYISIISCENSGISWWRILDKTLHKDNA